MTTIKRMMAAIAIVIFGMMLYACGSGSSSASDTLTSAQVQSMIDAAVNPLKTELAADEATIKTLQSSRVAAVIKAPNATASLSGANRTEARTEATGSTTCPSLGTLTGRPTTSDPIQSNIFAGITCTGYYFDISGAATSSDYGYIRQISTTILQVGFDAPDCGGKMYIMNAPAVAVANGFVFTLNPSAPSMNGSDWDNAANYWYVSAGKSVSAFNIQSVWTDGYGCGNVGSTPDNGYAAIQNDPSVTGIPNAPIQGPITISN